MMRSLGSVLRDLKPQNIHSQQQGVQLKGLVDRCAQGGVVGLTKRVSFTLELFF